MGMDLSNIKNDLKSRGQEDLNDQNFNCGIKILLILLKVFLSKKRDDLVKVVRLENHTIILTFSFN